MPVVSQKQRGLIFGKRNQYETEENTPKKWKWIWESGWENEGKLPKKAEKKLKKAEKKANKKKINEITSYSNFIKTI